jgi:hypothetical protein
MVQNRWEKSNKNKSKVIKIQQEILKTEFLLEWEGDIWKDRKTERQKDRKTERQKDRKTERQKDRKTERQKDRKTFTNK